jgi:hypothetical protein
MDCVLYDCLNSDTWRGRHFSLFLGLGAMCVCCKRSRIWAGLVCIGWWWGEGNVGGSVEERKV